MLLCLPVPFNPKNRSKVRRDMCHRSAGSLSVAHEWHLTWVGGCAVWGAPMASTLQHAWSMPCKSTVHVTKTQFTVINTIILNFPRHRVISWDVLTLGHQSTHRTGPTAKHNPDASRTGQPGMSTNKNGPRRAGRSKRALAGPHLPFGPLQLSRDPGHKDLTFQLSFT